MTRYRFKRGLPVKGLDPQLVGEEFEKILTEKDKELLDPVDVVERAENKNSPLHNAFEWDNSVAGGKWRLHQARNLINTTVIVVETKDGEEEIRAYARITADHEKGYRAIGDVMTDEILFEQYYGQIRVDLRRCVRRCQQFEKLRPYIVKLEEILKALESIKQEAM